MTKKILLVSWHFPPYKSSSAFNLFKRLKDTGYEYDVLQIRRVDKPDNDAMFRFASSRFNRYEIEVPSEDARNADARDHYVNKVIELYNVLKQKNHYSAMISHSHEIASHMAAMAIKKRNLELPWVASFGDPIAANPFNESYKFPMLQEDSQTEAQVLQQADRIIVTNHYQKELVTATQAQPVDREKFFILPHCFDERMYSNSSKSNSINTNTSNTASITSVFRFMHIGMLYKFKRTAEPFMLGAQRLLQKHPEIKGRFVLEFYGANDRYIKAAADYGLADTVNFNGTVSYLDSLSLMTEADCLLLRDADFSDYGLEYTPFYPGKLADYLGAKKPILAVTMLKGCVPDMFDQLNYPYCKEDDVEAISDTMYQAINGKIVVNDQEANKYSCEHVSHRAKYLIDNLPIQKTILFAGHDLKFIKNVMHAYEVDTKYNVIIDKWKNHIDHNEDISKSLLNDADIIFCEWGLGNIKWYSHNKKKGQKLVVRVHLQENQRPEFLRDSIIDNIDYFIFIAPYRYEEFVAMHNIPRYKAKMIFNTVDVEKFKLPKLPEAQFTLGFIGMVPWRKRFDRALDIFEKLWLKDNRYLLRIKGKRPEDYPWMLSKGRTEEMQQYNTLYERIKVSPWKNSIIYDGHGDDMPQWFQKVGYILSTSDFEGSHQAVAEGMSSGSFPLIYNWDGADTVYPREYVSEDIEELVANTEKGKVSQEALHKYAFENFSSSKVIQEIKLLCQF